MDTVVSFACLATAALRDLHKTKLNCRDEDYLVLDAPTSLANLNSYQTVQGKGKDKRNYLKGDRAEETRRAAGAPQSSLSCCGRLLGGVSSLLCASGYGFRSTCEGRSGDEYSGTCSSSSLARTEALMLETGEFRGVWKPHNCPEKIVSLNLWGIEDAWTSYYQFRHRMCTTFRLLRKGAYRFPAVRQWLWESYASIPSSDALIMWSIEAAEREEVDILFASSPLLGTQELKAFHGCGDTHSTLSKCTPEAMQERTDATTPFHYDSRKCRENTLNFSVDRLSQATKITAYDRSQRDDSEDVFELRRCLLHRTSCPPPLKILPPLFVLYVLAADAQRRQSSLLLPLLNPEGCCPITRNALLHNGVPHFHLYPGAAVPIATPVYSPISSFTTRVNPEASTENTTDPLVEIYYGWDPVQKFILNNNFFYPLLGGGEGDVYKGDLALCCALRRTVGRLVDSTMLNMLCCTEGMGCSACQHRERMQRIALKKAFMFFEEALFFSLSGYLLVQLRRCCELVFGNVNYPDGEDNVCRKKEEQVVSLSPLSLVSPAMESCGAADTQERWKWSNISGQMDERLMSVPCCTKGPAAVVAPFLSISISASFIPWSPLEYCLYAMERYTFTGRPMVPHPERRKRRREEEKRTHIRTTGSSWDRNEENEKGQRPPAVEEREPNEDDVVVEGTFSGGTSDMARECWRGVLKAVGTCQKGVLSAYLHAVLQPLSSMLLPPRYRRPLWCIRFSAVSSCSPLFCSGKRASTQKENMEEMRHKQDRDDENGNENEEEDEKPDLDPPQELSFLPSFRQLLSSGLYDAHKKKVTEDEASQTAQANKDGFPPLPPRTTAAPPLDGASEKDIFIEGRENKKRVPLRTLDAIDPIRGNHAARTLLSSGGPPVLMALALREPVAHLTLIEQWWLLAVGEENEKENTRKEPAHSSDLVTCAPLTTPEACGTPSSSTSSTPNADSWNAVNAEREDEWELRVTAVFESFRCASLVGIRPHWSSYWGSCLPHKKEKSVPEGHFTATPAGIDGNGISSDAPFSAFGASTVSHSLPMDPSSFLNPGNANGTLQGLPLCRPLKRGQGTESLLPISLKPCFNCACFWRFKKYSPCVGFSLLLDLHRLGELLPEVSEEKPIQGYNGVGNVLCFYPAKYIGLEERLPSPSLPLNMPLTHFSSNTRFSHHDDSEEQGEGKRKRETSSCFLDPPKKIRAEGHAPRKIPLPFLRSAINTKTEASASPPSSTTTTNTTRAISSMRKNRAFDTFSITFDRRGQGIIEENNINRYPVITSFSDVSRVDSIFSPRTSFSLSRSEDNTPTTSTSLPFSSVHSNTLSQYIKDIQRTVTNSLRQVVESVLRDIASWWIHWPSTQRGGSSLIAVAGAGNGGRRVRLCLSQPFSIPIRRLLELRNEVAAHNSLGDAKGILCSCTRTTVEALVATCLSFCSYSIPRWLLEALLRLSHPEVSGIPFCRASHADFVLPTPVAAGGVGPEAPSPSSGSDGVQRDGAGLHPSSSSSFRGLLHEVLFQISQVKEKPPPSREEPLVEENALQFSSQALPPSIMELKTVHHLLQELYRVVRRLLEAWRGGNCTLCSSNGSTAPPPEGAVPWSLLQCPPICRMPKAKSSMNKDRSGFVKEEVIPEGMTASSPDSARARTTFPVGVEGGCGVGRSVHNRFLSTILMSIENWALIAEGDVNRNEEEAQKPTREDTRQALLNSLRMWHSLFFS